jgi:hypothetical protein
MSIRVGINGFGRTLAFIKWQTPLTVLAAHYCPAWFINMQG